MRWRVRLRAGLTALLWLSGVVLSACGPGAGDDQQAGSQIIDASGATALHAGSVIQIVTFRFAPGRSAAALGIFEDQARPLYERNQHMLEFRAYREVESPSHLDLVVISRFAGMAGMDESNSTLRALAVETGTSIGAIYGAISEHSLGHTDEFVQLDGDATLASMDPERLVVLEYLEAAGAADHSVTAATMLPEVAGVTGGVGGRTVIANGWTHFRMYGVSSLGTVQRVANLPAMETVDGSVRVARRKRVVLARVDALSVR